MWHVVFALVVGNQLPCCTTPEQLEVGRYSRCQYRKVGGLCSRPVVAAQCQLSCGKCVRCGPSLGICVEPRLRAEVAKANWENGSLLGGAMAARPHAFNAQSLSLLDNVWCTTYPRCAIFRCCELYPFCHEPSAQAFGLPSRNGTRRTDTQGHPRFAAKETRRSLEEAIAALPYTQPAQFRELARRSEFRILYLVQGASSAKLPAHYEIFNLPGSGRHFMFSAFARDDADSVYFPKSNIGEARNMLYLMAREQEIRQGWMYNYVVMLDDDVEFEVYDPTQHAEGSPELARLALLEYAEFHRKAWREVLDDKLREWEQFLAYVQPALGALCWFREEERCSPKYFTTSTCHTDHKIVAYHREALETLLPMPTHRDATCWWASQFMNTIEVSLYYRGRTMYYPGSLRVMPPDLERSRAIYTPSRTLIDPSVKSLSKFEAHNTYPRRCSPGYTIIRHTKTGAVTTYRARKKGKRVQQENPNVTTLVNWRDVYILAYHDLRAVASSGAWSNGSTDCFDDMVSYCKSAHGSFDILIRAKGNDAYYWDPNPGSNSTFRQPCITMTDVQGTGSKALTYRDPRRTLSRTFKVLGARRHERVNNVVSPKDEMVNFGKMSDAKKWHLANDRCDEDEVC